MARRQTRASVEHAFWTKTQRRGPDECWEWQGARVSGYGRMYAGGTMVGAHRVSWVLHNGPMPRGRLVLHHCDNPGCVNPAHLYLGDHKDNAHDAAVRGHIGAGARLTPDQVREIRRKCYETMNFMDIAKEYDVGYHTIRNIHLRRTWQWLDPAEMLHADTQRVADALRAYDAGDFAGGRERVYDALCDELVEAKRLLARWSDAQGDDHPVERALRAMEADRKEKRDV